MSTRPLAQTGCAQVQDEPGDLVGVATGLRLLDRRRRHAVRFEPDGRTGVQAADQPA